MSDTEHAIASRRLSLFVIRERLAEPTDLQAETHLDADEIGCILAAAVLPAELARLEGHLTSCPGCADMIEELREAERAGLQPQFLPRRPSIRTAQQRLGTRLTRRYTPMIIAIVVFMLATAIPISQGWLTGKGELTVGDLVLLVDHVGTPVSRLPNDDIEQAKTGGWLTSNQQLILEAGDSLRVLKANGQLGTVTRLGVEWGGDPSPTLERLFQWLHAESKTRRRSGMRGRPKEPGAASPVRWVHPLGVIYSQRPTFYWVDADGRSVGTLRVEREPDERTGELLGHGRMVHFPDRQVSRGSCQFPGGALDLSIGGAYMARLNIDGGASELAIRFRVVSKSRHSQMTPELAEIDRQGGRAVRYLRAEYLMSQGCFSEARRELEQLRIGDERNVRLVARLLFACEELQLVVEAAALSALMQKWQR